MYQAEAAAALIKTVPRARVSWTSVAPTVLLLGATSLFADISSEMVSTTLPLYLLITLRISPFNVALMDGIYQSAAVLVRVASALVADRWRRPKQVAATGYGLSAVCKLGFLAVGSNWGGIANVLLLDRIGKGIRTAPRDAMIAASSARRQLATAFGVHRAMDTAGAMLGPLLAMVILAASGQNFDAIFVVSFCIAVIGVAVIVLFVDNPPIESIERNGGRLDDAGGDRASRLTLGSIGTLLRQSEFRSLIVVGTALSAATVSDSLLYLALRERLPLSTGVFPLLYIGTALAFMTLAIPAGRLADRFGARIVFVIGYGLLAAVYGLLLLPTVNYAVAALILIVLGCYYAATDGVLMALASRMLPGDLRATGLALLTTGTGLARLLASALYGIVWSAYGAERALIVFLGGLAATVWLASRAIPRTEMR